MGSLLCRQNGTARFAQGAKYAKDFFILPPGRNKRIFSLRTLRLVYFCQTFF